MKRVFTLMTVVMLMYGLTGPAHATLIDNDDGTITQMLADGSSLMWLQDANYAGHRMTWDEAMAWAGQLVYGGFDDWRLPTALNRDGSGPCDGSNCTGSEMGNLYYIGEVTLSNPNPFVFTNVKQQTLDLKIWWSSTERKLNSCSGYPYAWGFEFVSGLQYADPKSSHYYAWAVRDLDCGPAQVPEPTTMLLLGTGLIGLAGLGRKKLFKR